MMIIQFQIVNFTEEEIDLVEDFCTELRQEIIEKYIDTNLNEQKIKKRFNHLKEVSWIKWKTRDKKLNYTTIIRSILDSFKLKRYKNNVYKLETDMDKQIPNTYTSLDRLIRFINSGDIVTPPTNIFTNIQQRVDHSILNSLWRLFLLRRLGYLTESKLVTRIN